jgi:hypothetical protein
MFVCTYHSHLIHEGIPAVSQNIFPWDGHVVPKLRHYIHGIRTNLTTLTHTSFLLCSQVLQWYTTNWQWTVKLIESRGKAKTTIKLTWNLIKKKLKECFYRPTSLRVFLLSVLQIDIKVSDSTTLRQWSQKKSGQSIEAWLPRTTNL